MQHWPRKRHRISAGAVEAWRAALGELTSHTRDLVLAGLFLAAMLLVANLPWLPSYERGLLTGMIVLSALWLASWRMWVTSGHSLRLNGIWAEQQITQSLKDSPLVYGVVPSVKFEHSDVDVVAITRHAVLAVETKWHLGEVTTVRLDRDVHQAARLCRSLFLQLSVDGLDRRSVRPLVVLCGPKASYQHPSSRSVQVGFVTTVDIVGSAHLNKWLEQMHGGHIAPDFAKVVLADLEVLARQRDVTTVSANRLLRRLARIS